MPHLCTLHTSNVNTYVRQQYSAAESQLHQLNLHHLTNTSQRQLSQIPWDQPWKRENYRNFLEKAEYYGKVLQTSTANVFIVACHCKPNIRKQEQTAALQNIYRTLGSTLYSNTSAFDSSSYKVNDNLYVHCVPKMQNCVSLLITWEWLKRLKIFRAAPGHRRDGSRHKKFGADGSGA